jgi:hypothetical protein
MGEPGRSLADALREQRVRSAESMTPAQLAAVERMIERLVRDGLVERARRAGEQAPDFALPEVRGGEIRLGDLLGRGPVVLAFYRGGW